MTCKIILECMTQIGVHDSDWSACAPLIIGVRTPVHSKRTTLLKQPLDKSSSPRMYVVGMYLPTYGSIICLLHTIISNNNIIITPSNIIIAHDHHPHPTSIRIHTSQSANQIRMKCHWSISVENLIPARIKWGGD